MTRGEMLIRLGFYIALAEDLLGDSSYAARWRFHADDLTDEDYWRVSTEIQSRLVAAGKIAPDSDPFEERVGATFIPL